MAEQKFNHTLEEAARTYFDAAGFVNDDRFGTPAALMNVFIRGKNMTLDQAFERASGAYFKLEYLTTIIVRKESVLNQIPENTFRYYLALQTQRELGEVEMEVLKRQLAPICGIKTEKIEPATTLEERRRNLENLKNMLLAQPD